MQSNNKSDGFRTLLPPLQTSQTPKIPPPPPPPPLPPPPPPHNNNNNNFITQYCARFGETSTNFNNQVALFHCSDSSSSNNSSEDEFSTSKFTFANFVTHSLTTNRASILPTSQASISLNPRELDFVVKLLPYLDDKFRVTKSLIIYGFPTPLTEDKISSDNEEMLADIRLVEAVNNSMSRIQMLEAKALQCRNTARVAMKANNEKLAVTHMRRAKSYELEALKVAQSLHNVESMLNSFRSLRNNVKLAEVYSIANKAFKLARGDLDASDVAEILDDVKEEMDESAAIGEALGVAGDLNLADGVTEEELDGDLAALMGEIELEEAALPLDKKKDEKIDIPSESKTNMPKADPVVSMSTSEAKPTREEPVTPEAPKKSPTLIPTTAERMMSTGPIRVPVKKQPVLE